MLPTGAAAEVADCSEASTAINMGFGVASAATPAAEALIGSYRVGPVEYTRYQHARMQNSDLISDSELNRNFLHDAFRKKFSCMRSGGSQCIPLH